MTRLVRKLDKKIWIDKEVASREGWLDTGSVCADALKNFKTSENRLSVFSLAQEDLLPRIVCAIVASPNTKNVPDTDYVIFDRSIIAELGISTEDTSGETLDDEVNSLHIDLTRLSGLKLVQFAEKLQEHGKIGRITKKELAKVLNTQIQAGTFVESELSEDLLASIKKHTR